MVLKALLALFLLLSDASAQLSGSVGPTTSLSSKQATVCNVLDYGGSVGSSDIGPAISSACTVGSHFTTPFLVLLILPINQNCVLTNSGSTLYVPEGASVVSCCLQSCMLTKPYVRQAIMICRRGSP